MIVANYVAKTEMNSFFPVILGIVLELVIPFASITFKTFFTKFKSNK